MCTKFAHIGARSRNSTHQEETLFETLLSYCYASTAHSCSQPVAHGKMLIRPPHGRFFSKRKKQRSCHFSFWTRVTPMQRKRHNHNAWLERVCSDIYASSLIIFLENFVIAFGKARGSWRNPKRSNPFCARHCVYASTQGRIIPIHYLHRSVCIAARFCMHLSDDVNRPSFKRQNWYLFTPIELSWTASPYVYAEVKWSKKKPQLSIYLRV